MPPIDRTIPVVSFLSLLVSLITLYVAHLRGPKIELVIAARPYRVEGANSEALQHNLHVRLLIANTGIRSGILHEVGFSSHDQAFKSAELEVREGGPLPTVLPPGDGWRGGAVLIFMLKSKQEWRAYIEKRETATVTVHFVHSTTFWSRVVSKTNIEIDLSYIKANIGKADA